VLLPHQYCFHLDQTSSQRSAELQLGCHRPDRRNRQKVLSRICNSHAPFIAVFLRERATLHREHRSSIEKDRVGMDIQMNDHR
jgi:hypothetical protein